MKKTLITLVISGVVASMLIGCSQGTEGNTTEGGAAPAAASLEAPAANTPATDATNATPAPADANK